MKDKILYLIVGILIGGIVATGIFMMIDKNREDSTPSRENFRNFDGSNMPDDFDPSNLLEGFDPNNIPEGGPGGMRTRTDTTETDTAE